MAKILSVNLADLKANIEDMPKGYEGLGGAGFDLYDRQQGVVWTHEWNSKRGGRYCGPPHRT